MYTLPQKPLLFLLPFSLAHRLTTSSSTGVTKGDGPRKAQDIPLPHRATGLQCSCQYSLSTSQVSCPDRLCLSCINVNLKTEHRDHFIHLCTHACSSSKGMLEDA